MQITRQLVLQHLKIDSLITRGVCRTSLMQNVLTLAFILMIDLIILINMTMVLIDYSRSKIEPTHEIMALIILCKLILQTRMQPSSGARCLIFCRTLCLLPYFMCANCEGSGKTARMRRRHLYDKYLNLKCWLNLWNHLPSCWRFNVFTQQFWTGGLVVVGTMSLNSRLKDHGIILNECSIFLFSFHLCLSLCRLFVTSLF